MHGFYNNCVFILILAGHKKYLAFLFLYSTYNNAVVHVFIRLLANSQSNANRKAGSGSAAALASETSISEGNRTKLDDENEENDNDVELVEVERQASHSHVQQLCCTDNGTYKYNTPNVLIFQSNHDESVEIFMLILWRIYGVI